MDRLTEISLRFKIENFVHSAVQLGPSHINSNEINRIFDMLEQVRTDHEIENIAGDDYTTQRT